MFKKGERDYISIDLTATVTSKPVYHSNQKRYSFKIEHRVGRDSAEFCVLVPENAMVDILIGDIIAIQKAGFLNRKGDNYICITNGSYISVIRERNDSQINVMERYI